MLKRHSRNNFMKFIAVCALFLLSSPACAARPATKASTEGAAPDRPVLRVRIAVPAGDTAVLVDAASHFHVVIENVSERPQKVIEETNSWGYSTLRFEYVTNSGEKKVMAKRDRAWKGNYLTVTTLDPGEVAVRDVYLDDAVWSNMPVPERGEAKVRLRAVFEQAAEDRVDAWQGRVASPERAITFRRQGSSAGGVPGSGLALPPATRPAPPDFVVQATLIVNMQYAIAVRNRADGSLVQTIEVRNGVDPSDEGMAFVKTGETDEGTFLYVVGGSPKDPQRRWYKIWAFDPQKGQFVWLRATEPGERPVEPIRTQNPDDKPSR